MHVSLKTIVVSIGLSLVLTSCSPSSPSSQAEPAPSPPPASTVMAPPTSAVEPSLPLVVPPSSQAVASAPLQSSSWLPKVSEPSNLDQTIVWGQLPKDVTLWSHADPNYYKMIRAALPLERAFKYTFGEGQRTLIVFFDPLSGYDLGMFKGWLDQQQKFNATVYVFPYSPESGSQPFIDQLICSSNPAQKWLEWVQFAAPDPNKNSWDVQQRQEEWRKIHPDVSSQCKAIKNKEALQGIAKRLDVSFTPTMIFASGEAWPGPTISDRELEQVWSYVHGRLGL